MNSEQFKSQKMDVIQDWNVSEMTSVFLTSQPPAKSCHAEKDHIWFLMTVNVFVQNILFLLAFIGNTLSFIVLPNKRSGSKDAAIFQLQTMAVIDNLFLLTTGFLQTFSTIALFTDHLHEWLTYLQIILWPIVLMMQFCAVWITVLIAFIRFIAIYSAFKADNLCSLKRVQLQIVIMVFVAILYNLPHFFEYRLTCQEIGWSSNNYTAASGNSDVTATSPAFSDNANNTCHSVGTKTALKDNWWYNVVYDKILYCIVVFLIPLVLLIIFNIALIRYIQQPDDVKMLPEDSKKPMLSKSEQKERKNVTSVIKAIIFVFIFTQTPASVNAMLYSDGRYHCNLAYFYFFHISNLIASSHSCLNFLVYCVFRRNFYKRLLELRCQCGRNRGQRISTITERSRTSEYSLTAQTVM